MTSEQMLWTSLSIIGMITFPVLVILLIAYFKPPKKINSWYGYRTKRSMQSEENWRFANELSTKIALIGVIIFTVLAVLKSILFQDFLFSGEGLFSLDLSINTLLVGLMPFIITIIYTESQLKKRDGKTES